MKLINAVKAMVNNSYDQYSNLINSDTLKAVSNFKEIMHKSSVNLKYRMKLMDAPVPTLAHNGFVLPTGFNIKFVEDSGNTLHIPIPQFAGEYAICDKTAAEEHEKIQVIIHKAISDLNFRENLVANPAVILKNEGFILPPNTKIVILECSDDLTYVVLPPYTGSSHPQTAQNISCKIKGNTFFLSGRIDASTVDELKNILMDNLNQAIVIDMHNIEYISSIGLGLLLMTRKKLAENKFSMQIINIPSAIRNVFVLSGFDKIFDL